MRKTKKELNGIIIGMLLGNGSINKFGNLSCTHSIKQKEYVDYKANLLKDNFSIYKNEKTVKLSNGKEFKQYYLNCGTTKYTKQLRKIFYKPNKVINKSLLKKLTPLGLAIWYMDDGSLVLAKQKNGEIRSRKGYLNTQCFTYKENLLFQEYFKETWNIETKIHKDKKYYKLYFNSSELKKLINIIEPYIIDSMKYKICYRYSHNNINLNLCGKECHYESCIYNSNN